METPDLTAPAQGAGLVYRGTWTSKNRRLTKPVLFSRNVFMIASEVLPHFGIGERSGFMNPKYAKLGWTDALENDEWWANLPTAQL